LVWQIYIGACPQGELDQRVIPAARNGYRIPGR
jgi:hypothetical protein